MVSFLDGSSPVTVHNAVHQGCPPEKVNLSSQMYPRFTGGGGLQYTKVKGPPVTVGGRFQYTKVKLLI